MTMISEEINVENIQNAKHKNTNNKKGIGIA
jgi:hypothetical protein